MLRICFIYSTVVLIKKNLWAGQQNAKRRQRYGYPSLVIRTAHGLALRLFILKEAKTDKNAFYYKTCSAVVNIKHRSVQIKQYFKDWCF